VRIVCIEHVTFEKSAMIEFWANSRGHAFQKILIYQDSLLPALSSFDWLVLMGGPMKVYQEQEHPWLVAEKELLTQALEAGKEPQTVTRSDVPIFVGAACIVDLHQSLKFSSRE